MAKRVTPEMLAINKKNEHHNKRRKKRGDIGSSFWYEAWKRLKRNRTAVFGMVVIAFLFLIAIFADVIAPYSYSETNIMEAYQGPSAAHLFGTDNLGRDIFSRSVYAARVSLPLGLITAAGSVIIGGVLGLVAAYFAGTVDLVIMRIMDILQAIPSLLMAITVVASFGLGTVPLIIAVSISCVPNFAKTVRSGALAVRGNEYIDASRSLGASNLRLMFKHILPNSVGYIIIFLVGTIAGNINFISTMSYVGLGVQAPTPEWGSMLATGKNFIQSYPYMVIFPGIMILLTIFAFNLFGDGVRDALDPRLK